MELLKPADDETKIAQDKLLKLEGKSPTLKAEIAQIVRKCERLKPFILLSKGEAKIILGDSGAITDIKTALSIILPFSPSLA